VIRDSWKRHYEDYALKSIVKGAITAWGVATHPIRRLPDFLIIGAQRAGTTSLYRYLVAHPAVASAMPSKGVHYFDTHFDESLAWYRGHFPTILAARYTRVRRGVDLITGEASPYYLFHPRVPERVADALPNVKLIVLLRDPIERAYSHYANEVARGYEELSFEQALDREARRLKGESEKLETDPGYHSLAHQHHSYLARGLYLEQIERWRSFFPRDQLQILSAERLFADPSAVLAEVHDFLGVERRPLAAYEEHNARRREPMRRVTREWLEEFFAEPNRRLFDYLGADFGWNRRSERTPPTLTTDVGARDRA
jgi:Sulfotransferase domain